MRDLLDKQQRVEIEVEQQVPSACAASPHSLDPASTALRVCVRNIGITPYNGQNTEGPPKPAVTGPFTAHTALPYFNRTLFLKACRHGTRTCHLGDN